MKKTAPFGSWESPIKAATLTAGTVAFSEPRFDAETLYWLESRPEEKGRTTLIRLQPEAGAQPQTLLPRPINVRSKVNEYGGGAYCVHNGFVYFVLADDQRIYRLDCRSSNDGKALPAPEPLTVKGLFRYADLIVDPHHKRLLAVCEQHGREFAEAQTYLVAIALPADKVVPVTPQVLIHGADFYSSPQPSPNGQQLCWISWNHPNMPWDNSELWLAKVDGEGQVHNARAIAGANPEHGESICQPRWSPSGVLHFVSDRNNWWSIYSVKLDETELVLATEAEFTSPQWVFGLSTYDFVDEQTLVCCYSRNGSWELATLNLAEKQLHPVESELTDIAYVRSHSDQVVFIGSSPEHLANLYRVSLADDSRITKTPSVVAHASTTQWNSNLIAAAEAIEYPLDESQTAHAFFYPPRNPHFQGPAGAKPPLLVLCHGGPTAATHSSLNLKIQFWTSRGFAVVDINYRGSSGYGRHYRRQLNGHWGVNDVADAAAAVNFLAAQGKIDIDKVAIKGSSAGGFTVLAALTFTDVFKAGASHYGIGDLETLAQDTHKFESRYMDTLVGPYPQCRELYRRRSPINAIEQLHCPVIFFQGLEDKVVPPNQAQAMVKALDKKHIPVAYVTFAEEGHGFRQAQNIQRAIEAELYFYSKVFGFPLADKVAGVEIRNLSPPT